MLPRGVDGLIAAGRHYSATEPAQKISREIPPCMSMGQAAGVAAALAVDRGVAPRDVEPKLICHKVRAQGGDPGDRPSANARVLEDQMRVRA
jgi:FAD-dependent oxidoreductase family protein